MTYLETQLVNPAFNHCGVGVFICRKKSLESGFTKNTILMRWSSVFLLFKA